MERFEIVRRFQENWQKKTPRQKCLAIYSIPSKLGESIGIRVYTDQKVTWLSYMPLVFAMIHIPTVAYTLWIHQRKGELLIGMRCLCTSGVVISMYAIYFKAIGKERTKIKNAVNFGIRNIYTDSNVPSKYHSVCERMINALIKDIIIVVSVILMSVNIFGMSILYAIFFEGERITFIETQLPFVDFETDFGYAVNIIQQSAFNTMGLIANLTVEIGGCFAYNAVEAVPDLFHLESEELEAELKSKGMSRSAELRVRNILMQVQDLNMAVEEAVGVYYTRLLLGPIFIVMSISFSIFSQMTLGYKAGYGCAMFNYMTLLIFCYLGENLKQTNEKIALELYCMPWYLLSPSSQKGISSGIHWMQNGPAFTIGPFKELSFETASDLTKAVYRFTMLLFKLFV